MSRDIADTSKTMILGVGNLLMRDEGIGVHAAVNLQGFPLPGHIEVIEGGTDGFRLFNLIIGASRLIVVDCVKGGDAPGSIYRFGLDDYDHFPDIYKTSVHQIGIDEVITLSGTISTPPETTFIGVEPEEIFMSMELSDTIRSKLPKVMEIALETAGLDPGEYRKNLGPPFIQPGPRYPEWNSDS